MILFTADHHFGHSNIIRHCNRPFQSVDEMNDVLLDNWNSAVKPGDTVYIIGDLFFRNAIPAEDFLHKLKGKKYLIIGNHDKDWMKRTDLPKYFESAERMMEISTGAHKVTLCHYPMMTWNAISKGSYMIHGHIHNNTDADYFQFIRNMPNILNAGVEINDYKPVSFNDLIKNNQRFKITSQDKNA